MADLDFIELQGNGVLLEAARLLRLFAQVKDKPGKVTRGNCEYAERVARHCFSMHQKLEGVAPGANAAGWEALIDSDDESGTASPALGALALEKSREAFDAWHSQLGIAVDAVGFVFGQIDDTGLGSVADVLHVRLEGLLGDAPWPGGGTARS